MGHDYITCLSNTYSLVSLLPLLPRSPDKHGSTSPCICRKIR